MFKSVLTMNTPDRCDDCLCVDTYDSSYQWCRYAKKKMPFSIHFTKPDWCPLNPLPEKDDWDDPYDEYYTGYANGWNRCLSKITGEDDELC